VRDRSGGNFFPTRGTKRDAQGRKTISEENGPHRADESPPQETFSC